jgi:hypothetical protein
MKRLILIQLRFVTFEISPLNIQVLEGEVIPATGSRFGGPIGVFTLARQIPPVL